jgi:RNase P/RNase MRP subunit POP5
MIKVVAKNENGSRFVKKLAKKRWMSVRSTIAKITRINGENVKINVVDVHGSLRTALDAAGLQPVVVRS